MPTRRIHIALPVATVPERVRSAFSQLRGELGIPALFPPEVVAEAELAANRSLADCPECLSKTGDRLDLRGIPFVAIDPPGAMDLDQAVHLSRSPDGYVIEYAIADVAFFVPPEGATAAEATARGLTSTPRTGGHHYIPVCSRRGRLVSCPGSTGRPPSGT